MARLPGWLIVDNPRIDSSGQWVVGLRLRLWHPGFWLLLLRIWWGRQLGAVRPG